MSRYGGSSEPALKPGTLKHQQDDEPFWKALLIGWFDTYSTAVIISRATSKAPTYTASHISFAASFIEAASPLRDSREGAANNKCPSFRPSVAHLASRHRADRERKTSWLLQQAAWLNLGCFPVSILFCAAI